MRENRKPKLADLKRELKALHRKLTEIKTLREDRKQQAILDFMLDTWSLLKEARNLGDGGADVANEASTLLAEVYLEIPEEQRSLLQELSKREEKRSTVSDPAMLSSPTRKW